MKNTAGYYLAFIAIGMTAAIMGPTLPDLAAQTKTGISGIGILFTLRAIGYLIGAWLGGRMYDRIQGHSLMTGSLVLMSITLFLVPLSAYLWLLMAVVLVMGFAEGIIDVGGNAMLVWVHGSKVGPFMNGLHFFFGAGAFVAPLIVAQTLNAGGSRLAYWVIAVLVAAPALWIVWLPSPASQATQTEGKEQKTTNPLLLGLIALFLFLYVGVEIGYSGWLFTYAVETNLAAEASAAYLTSLFWGFFTFGRLLSIPIATRLRPRHVLQLDFLGGFLALIGMVLFTKVPSALWVGSCLLGVSIASMFPTMISLAERHMTMSGQVTSIFFIASGFGAMSLPWLIGQFFSFIGPVYMVSVVLGIFLLALGALIAIGQVLANRTKSLNP